MKGRSQVIMLDKSMNMLIEFINQWNMETVPVRYSKALEEAYKAIVELYVLNNDHFLLVERGHLFKQVLPNKASSVAPFNVVRLFIILHELERICVNRHNGEFKDRYTELSHSVKTRMLQHAGISLKRLTARKRKTYSSSSLIASICLTHMVLYRELGLPSGMLSERVFCYESGSRLSADLTNELIVEFKQVRQLWLDSDKTVSQMELF